MFGVFKKKQVVFAPRLRKGVEFGISPSQDLTMAGRGEVPSQDGRAL
jgi:hypothetical protein